MMKYQHTAYTVRQLLELIGPDPIEVEDRTRKADRGWRHGDLDLAMEFQRVFSPSPAWMSLVVGSLLTGDLSGVMTFRRLDAREGRGLFQVIDGICRLTAISGFFRGHLKTDTGLEVELTPGSPTLSIGGLTWTQMVTKYGHDFSEYVMDQITVEAHIYDVNMTPGQAAKKFRELNNGNRLSEQETRQAFAGPLSEAIRSMSRTGETSEFPLVPMFDYCLTSPILKLKRRRLNLDEVMAKSFQYVEWHRTNKTHGIYAATCNRVSLDQFYQGTLQQLIGSKSVRAHAAYVRGVWDQVYQIIRAAKDPRILSANEPMCMFLFHLVLHLRTVHTETVQFNYPILASNLSKALKELKDRKRYTPQVLREHSGKTPFKYLLPRVFPRELKMKFALMMQALPKDLVALGVHVPGQGDFSRDQVAHALVEQAYQCRGCGASLTEDQAQGDHIHPQQLGGSNETENCQALCQPCNGSKGKKTMAQWVTTVLKTPGHKARPYQQGLRKKSSGKTLSNQALSRA